MAAEAVETNMAKPQICVLGAGVIGMTTAVRLQEEIPGAEITVIADRFYEDTVSYVAAGMFRCGDSPTFGGNIERTRKVLQDSWDFYYNLLKSDQASNAGISEVPVYLFSNLYQHNIKFKLMDEICKLSRPCTPQELLLYPGGAKYGQYYLTLVTQCNHFIPWLVDKFLKKCGLIVSKHINSLKELDQFDVVVNCCGFSGIELCNDTSVYPVRGQVFKVKAPWIKHAFYEDLHTYIVPGIEIVTVGGTRQVGFYNTEVNPHDSADIWERATKLIPSLKNAEIVAEKAGLRPNRAQIRIEKEVLYSDSGREIHVVHQYGHGGQGVMTAPGSANYAIELVKEMLTGNTTNKQSSKL